MGVYFLDSSVLVKHYLVEPGTGWTRQLEQIKGYDAVQIASALLIARETPVPLTLVSGDNQMLRAARAVGLATDNPFDHEDEG